MKIQDALNQLKGVPAKTGNDDKKTADVKENRFSKHLMKAGSDNYEEHLSSMIDQITDQGKTLSEHVDIRDLKRYRKMISEFLYEAVNNSHKFNKESMLDRRGRHKTYAIISKVNSSVDELAKEVLKAEKDNIKVLQKLDDIRGLLLDIIM